MKKRQTTHFRDVLTAHCYTVKTASKVSGIGYDIVWKHVKGLRRVTAEWAVLYEEKLGIPRNEIRPDLWWPQCSHCSRRSPDAKN